MLKNQQNRLLSCVLIGFCLWLSGCGPDGEKPQSDAAFFPLQVGDFKIYHVNETQITAYNIETDFEYELKTMVTDSFQNANGGYSYIMNRLKRDNDTQPWQALDTWTIRADTKEVVVTEGSTPFVRLTFPIKNNRTWNGNAYNDIETGKFCTTNGTPQECDPYTLDHVGQTHITTDGTQFDDTIEVIQSNDPDLIIKYDVRSEIYARGIGLIVKESTIYNYCTQSSCSGQQSIESGIRLKQELIQYGRE